MELLWEIQESQPIIISSQVSTTFVNVVNKAAFVMIATRSYFNEGMDRCITPLTADFSAINTIVFKQILNNKFNSINISKLYMDVSLV